MVPLPLTSNRLILASLSIVCLPTLWYFSNQPWRLLRGVGGRSQICDVFRGRWVPFPDGPLYTNSSCPEIFDQQNCMKYGRPDTEFLKWRWKPNQCELPIFDAHRFLELVRGKSMAFVGDSVARNHMQSLMCLLSTAAAIPQTFTHIKDSKSRHWHYQDYDFTVASFWSPYLVKTEDVSGGNETYNRLVNLHVDEPHPDWASKIETFDYVIVSAARWFFGPQMYSLKNKTVGCFMCPSNHTRQLSMFYGYREAFRTTFDTLMRLENFRGVTFLRALSPAHFETGEWNEGGSCPRTEPVAQGSARLSELETELYKIQKEEFKRAQGRGGLKFQLIDATDAMLVRPDGHPNLYGHWSSENMTIADCVHWCLPGPIDAWNDFLLHMIATPNGDFNSTLEN
uniref:Trichome birefringence-like N-terminal domain-containing protein n=1 Tax=Kalanchoe fedtschenkoi TaxID=63787 RepID=A0A7N0VK04_KALFE